ncbi:hypothetical protein [Mucilaginibacter paludis]|uniref:DUF3575 domain-containing protein n=1 Tax=Mucilaginibacter paludis DSM 18603 TaxID=714943 RepID=H1Y0A7_9SPHI|nr:hypothetical protein [Mucilaginibacter paludis]EHQ28156.1 hypothetical protein Mucpa_4065 [Mucilaginibacter paludis DSM 18603]
MKKLLLFALTLSGFLFSGKKSDAQTYQFAAGLKFGGYENGISGKYFVKPDAALEGIFGFRKGGVVITGLYEINQTAFDVAELKFYFGGGAHVGSIGDAYQRFGSSNHDVPNNQILIGADGVVGLEYVIPKAPIAVSLDLNPRLELAGGPFFDLAPGIGVKYIF